MNPYISQKIVYPLLFSLRREPFYADIEKLRKFQWQDQATITERQLDKFRTVAAAGICSFDFYKRIVAEHEVSVKDMQTLDDLKRWPIMNKSELNRSVSELRRKKALPAHTVRMTGGSSGDPCLVLADRLTTSISVAARALFQEWYGIGVGDRQIRLWGRPLSTGYYREQLKGFILNRIRLDSLALGKDCFNNTFKQIINFGADYLYGYASLIALFIDTLNDEQLVMLRGGLKAAISTSETMSDDQRMKLFSRLGRPIVDEYGCSEIDIISFSCPEGGRHTAAENVLVEVVRTGDEPEGFGRTVVTDLNNTLMPVIRYCVGDLVPLDRPVCHCGRGWPCIGPVLGRIQNQFIELEGGVRRVHSQFIVYMLEGLFDKGWGIRSFQIVQEDFDLIVVKVVPQEGRAIDCEELRKILAAEGCRALGPNTRWRVDLVEKDELEIAASYKFQHFVSRISAREN
ncbi:hypothetical protein KI809_00220 [Geobacter pelophilus]|uniref:Phenylacetate-CoA ligase n=1 Tax=Geoanaerobacter pelophilus TaxID=60036 RepID=A0AAW4KWN4_9BACT|nr:hypothetical protein [Geoanaerobacter pelophilus]MBT0662714.1 hypothetical protein [Geoanaerobacter pelophilus]